MILAVTAQGAGLDGYRGISLTQIVGLTLEFSDNVFELDEDSKDRLQYPRSALVAMGPITVGVGTGMTWAEAEKAKPNTVTTRTKQTIHESFNLPSSL